MGISENDGSSRGAQCSTDNSKADIRGMMKGSGSGSGSGSWWTLMDLWGEELKLELDKYAIMQRLRLRSRDLRILDPLLSYPSSILVRDKAIVVNLQQIKAIITAEEVLFRYPSNDDAAEDFRRKLTLLIRENSGKGKHMQHNIGKDEEEDLPFEFQVIELALEVISSSLDTETSHLENAIYQVLDVLTEKIDTCNLDRARILQNEMTKLAAGVQKIRDAMKQLLDDNNIHNHILSKKLATGTSSSKSNSPIVSKRHLASPTSKASIRAIHGDKNILGKLETLFEAYFSRTQGILNRLTTLREYVGCAQDFIHIQLEHQRNQLLQLELLLSTTSLCVHFVSTVAGLFGVSIPYKWNQNHASMFKWVVIISCSFSGLAFMLIISLARRRGLIGS